MRKVLAALFGLFLSISPVMASSWNPVAERVEKSLALLMAPGLNKICTAFSINEREDLVLTDEHCSGRDVEGKDILVNNLPVKIVAKDMRKDLMVLYVKGLDKPAVHLAKSNPRVGDEIASYGFGYALSKPLFRVTHASAIDTEEAPGQVITDTTFTPGQSGGPVVNEDGDLVMIVDASDGRGLGVGLGVESIRKSMGKFFEDKH